MQCSYCKLENAETAAACVYCRQPLAAPQAEERADGIWLIPPAPVAASHADAALAGADADPEPPAPETAAGAMSAVDRWLPRLVFFLGIFIVGLGLGLGGSGWYKLSGRPAASALEETAEQAEGSSTGSIGYRQPPPPIAASVDRERHRPPHDTAAAARAVLPRPPVALAPAPVAPPPAAADQTLQPTPPATASAKPAPKRPHRVAKNKKAAPAASAATSAASVRQAPSKQPSRHASSKPASALHGAPATGALQTADSTPGSKRYQLNQCENLESWIEREKCKWHYCSNQWGQHGCPAYPPPRSQQ